jgi:hypothetical protein
MIAPAVMAASSFGGAYVGGAVGAYTASISNKSDFGYTYEYSSDTNYAPSISAGYGVILSDKFYLGGEAAVTNGGAVSSRLMSDSSGVISKYTSKAGVGKMFAIRGGYVISDGLLATVKYGRGNTDYESSVVLCNTGSCTAGSSNRDMQSVGIGLMYGLTNTILATVEGSKNTPTGTTNGQDVAEYSVTVGVAYWF